MTNKSARQLMIELIEATTDETFESEFIEKMKLQGEEEIEKAIKIMEDAYEELSIRYLELTQKIHAVTSQSREEYRKSLEKRMK